MLIRRDQFYAGMVHRKRFGEVMTRRPSPVDYLLELYVNIMEIFLLAGDKREYLCVNPTKRTRYIRGGVQHELSISGRVWTTQESLKNPHLHVG